MSSSFGPNSAYINELYFEYLKNPNAFDATWREFFASYDPNNPDEAGNEQGAQRVVAASNGNGRVAAEPAPARPARETTNGGTAPAAKPAAAPAPAPAAQPAPKAEEAKAPTPIPEGARQLTGIGARIVQNMEASLQIPTATSFREIPVKLLEENRTLVNGYLKASDQGKLSFTHIVGWALVKALAKYQSLNNSFQNIDGKPYLVVRHDVNLGLAIDIERPDGGRSLVVPSIKRSNLMNFQEFFSAYETLVRKARRNELTPDDFMGTTLTLTNPGTIGTVASVPRLMVGQGTIIATGGINYPAAYQAMDVETLSELGISKVMEMTSTYDHRIIQGAESGLFLAYVQELLMGGEEFYEEIFRDLRIPYRPLSWARDRHPSIFGNNRDEAVEKQQRVFTLISSFRQRGHLQAYLNPLGETIDFQPDLDPSTYGLTIWDFDRTFQTGGMAGMERADLRTILSVLRDTYTQRVGVEYTHIPDLDQMLWLQETMETRRNSPNMKPEQKKRVLRKLSEAEGFEKFLQTKYTGHKRFSMEGAETTIPMLDELVERAALDGVKEVVIGMPHRGRLNVLATVIGKSPGKIFSEFEDNKDPNSVHGSGDVKYHLGERGTIVTETGERITIRLSPNPSHLEAVNPVVEGMVRALQDRIGDGGSARIIPVLLHGDAAFAGQGVVAETFNMSQLDGYHTGGTIHLVVNNQIGFTASPRDTRSTRYATDIAKMVGAPIFHVNADDPESSVYVMRLAYEYRQRYKRDVVVDLICYRRYGHNETDEPGYTQPLLYAKIKAHPSTRVVYTDRLLRNGTLTQQEVNSYEDEFKERLEGLLAATKALPPAQDMGDPLREDALNPHATWGNPQTGVPDFMLNHIIKVISSVPEDVDAHAKLVAQFEKRPKLAQEGKIDWAFAEALAFGSLLLEGFPVRLSGQDSQRGTFSQRHSVLHDQKSDARYVPLNNLAETQSRFMVYDSSLSEYAVLGFEYGYSVADPDALVLWEAQFGDFVNGAQIVIDQFITSSEDKWEQTSSVVLLLPHGFEGQGPEHSSARIERFLTLCAEDNIRVAYPTTAAQYFHLLRRQAKQEVRKPLVVLTPKSLLRDPAAAASMEELINGEFRRVIPEVDPIDPAGVRRVVLCSGKVYYDLVRARHAANQTDVAIVRIEKLYPFPSAEVRAELERYAHVTDIVWVQEEPKNMGMWFTLSDWIAEELVGMQKLSFLGRPASGSPAAGSMKRHLREQEEIVRRALGRQNGG
ncbi:MAG TPA: multifunctional oxoglutarate decarboxylase/oxoglutarate dehydrogenase thiamine pyrophosphate-binding subunit/dihydrolipoyllysine-residue succinyltransferase subunit [Candidatus Kapabacteria bacterium]|nr:multifunctional oxoglutarate decarboxylase/oxoglutarate dehydrogenase thiamine pyrophosphate-binding subunit/dihydrolipoyllysine-residue succinyltransferase subunit [Candidatus Kapabacteria bacterium]